MIFIYKLSLFRAIERVNLVFTDISTRISFFFIFEIYVVD